MDEPNYLTSLIPIAQAIDGFLQENKFQEAAFVGYLSEPILRVIVPLFSAPGSLSVAVRSHGRSTLFDGCHDEDCDFECPDWLKAVGHIYEGLGCADLLIWEGPLSKSELRGHITSMRRYIKPNWRSRMDLKLPRAIILIGEAATAAGHDIYQWEESPGLAIGE